jgi:class 3 adenylate cyclase
MKCAFCETELASNARMCKSCGHPVSLNPTLEDLYFSRLAANAPPEFIQLVRETPYLVKERRIVTAVLFSIANVDAFTETIPEEEQTQLLNHALGRFAKIIFEFEGTIAKLWENTILAFFGAPISHEDDPFRAMYAAQALLDENKKISQDIIKRYGIPIVLNLAINTGPVLIGDVRSNLKFDFQSLNQTLECLDSAVRGVVPSCEVMLFENTYRYLKTFIECQKIDQLYCEDTDQTISLWRLIKINDPNQNRERLPLRENTPFVGRQKELDQLMELGETVLAGLGRVGVIYGEPGIGKSRLLTEWKHNLRSLRQSSQILWVESQGIAFGRDNAYHLLKTLLRNLLQISESVSLTHFTHQITGLLGATPDLETENRLIYIAHLLDIPISDEDEKRIHQLNALELRAQYQNAIRHCLRRIAVEQPLIIILEDLHWADPSSVEIVIDLLSLSSSLPLLFCLVTRQDRDTNGWRLVQSAQEKFGPRLTQIELNNFTEVDSEAFVKGLISIEEIPPIL